MKLAVVLVHGIGNSRNDWARAIIPAIENRLRLKLGSLLGVQAPTDMKEVLVISRVYWEGIFKERERHLREKFNGFPGPIKAGGDWPARLKRWVWRPFKRVQNEIIANYIADIIGYLHKDAQRAVYLKISDTLRACHSRLGSPAAKVPLTVIAHSLGTVITSDYIYEQGRPESDTSGPKVMRDHFVLDNLFTVGSPLALFSMRFGGPEMFIKPVAVESARGRWVNIFDQDDPVGMPLKPLNPAYNRVVHQDVLVNSGVYGLAHGGYFKKHSKALDVICQKLAIDWIALNEKLPPERVAALYADYDRTAGLRG